MTIDQVNLSSRARYDPAIDAVIGIIFCYLAGAPTVKQSPAGHLSRRARKLIYLMCGGTQVGGPQKRLEEFPWREIVLSLFPGPDSVILTPNLHAWAHHLPF